MKKYLVLTATIFVFALSACGDDGGEGELSAAEDACEHMVEGPAESVTALVDTASDAPDIGEEHTRFDVTLVGDAGSLGGFVDLAIDEEGEFTVFMNSDVTMALQDGTGAAVAVEETNNNVVECSEVAIGHTVDLSVGTYSLELGPTAETEVQIVVVHEGEHEHDDE